MVTDKLHQLGCELLTLLRTISNTNMVHHIRQTHDTQPDPPIAESCFTQLGNRWHVSIRFNDIIEKNC